VVGYRQSFIYFVVGLTLVAAVNHAEASDDIDFRGIDCTTPRAARGILHDLNNMTAVKELGGFLDLKNGVTKSATKDELHCLYDALGSDDETARIEVTYKKNSLGQPLIFLRPAD
jgi:hypothetical protein